MEFSEAYELDELLRSSPGPRSRKTAQPDRSNISLLETMMTYGLDLEERLGDSPPDLMPHAFPSSSGYITEPVEPVKPEEKPQDTGPVVLQVTRDDNYKETYEQSLCKVSNLTQSLRTNILSKPVQGLLINVYLFGGLEKIRVSIPRKATLEQAIPRVISAYLNDEKLKVNPLPFGPVAEAYEFKYLDSNNLPEADLESSSRVKDLEVSSLGFVVKQEYADSLRITSISSEEPEDDAKTIKVYFEKRCNVVKISEKSTVRRIIEKLSMHYGYLNPDEYEFKVVVQVEELSEQECDISMDLKISSLTTDELKLYSKVYADTPSPSKIVKSLAPLKEPEGEVVYDGPRHNMTVAQASAYKEYEVIKTNRKGKRQKRILGINQIRLHNMTVAQAKQKLKEKAIGDQGKHVFRAKLKSIFESITHHPTIDISSIYCIEQDTKNLCCFYIDYIERGTKKKKLYETEKSSITVEIISKITKLMQLVSLI